MPTVNVPLRALGGKGAKDWSETFGQVHGSIFGIVCMGSHVSGTSFLLLLLVHVSFCFFSVSLALVKCPIFHPMYSFSYSGSMSLVNSVIPLLTSAL